MKQLLKIFIGLLIFLGVFFIPSSRIEASGANVITIKDNEYDLSLYSDLVFLDDRYEIEFIDGGKIKISEDLYVYFPNREYSGIYFAIPYKYGDDVFNQTTLDIDLEKVCYKPYWGADVGGTMKCSSYIYEKGERDVVLTIAEPGVYLQGIYRYEISYVVDNALIYRSEGNDNKSELYWNVIGTGRENYTAYSDVLIKKYSGLNPLDVVCYVGASGVSDQYCSKEKLANGDIYIKVERLLGIGEGYTIAVSYPEGSFAEILGGEPTPLEQVIKVISLYGGCCCPLPILILMFVVWWFKGRDTKAQGVIPIYSVPEGFSPLIASFVNNMSLKDKDISATLIDLAIKGYIKIEQVSKSQYFFHNLKKSSNWDNLTSYEKEILNGLFISGGSEKDSVSNGSLKERFYTTVSKVKRLVETEAVKNKKYFEGSPSLKRGIFTAIGIGFGFLMSLLSSISPFYILGGVVSGIIIIIFGFFMGKRSREGVLAYHEMLGLKMYIDLAEEERIKFFNNPDKFEQIKLFETLLPYAMIFGLEKKWAKEFENIYTEPPSWYSGYNVNNFNAFYLASALSSFNNSMRATTYASPQSEGSHVSSGGSGFSGGFSGGGFGGGSSGGVR